MMKGRRIEADKLMSILVAAYVLLPIFLFAWGWTKIVIAIIGSVTLAILGMQLMKSMRLEQEAPKLFGKNYIAFWIVTGVVIAVWVYMSGIGGLAYQNGDFWARNPIYRDLCTERWPVIFDFSSQSELVRQICGDGNAAFSYYFCWWLVPAFIAKLFGMGEAARNIVLMLWTWCGLVLVVYMLCRGLRKCTWYIPVVLILFSGLDAIPYWLEHDFLDTFPWVTHIEYWAGYFQYSCNTTQLFWVFNQAIPVWILMTMMLQVRDSKVSAALTAVSFAYSPWATFGMVPYAIYVSFKGKNNIKEAFSAANVTTVFYMLCIYGCFYLGGAGGGSNSSFIFFLYKGAEKVILKYYLIFVFFEFLIYFLVLGRKATKNQFYWLTLGELLIIPLFVVRDNNFVMRSSIPALFVLMYYILQFFTQGREVYTSKNAFAIRKCILVLVMCFGMMTPLAEINRSVVNTMAGGDLLEDPVGSFANMKTDEEWRVRVIKEQFFAYKYEDMIYFRYTHK